MNRERAETRLRLVAEAELRCATTLPRDGAATPREMPGAGRGAVALRQRSAVGAAVYCLPRYQREVIGLRDNERDRGFKAAAERDFAAARLAVGAQLNGQGVIWMVAGDPTFTSGERVVVDTGTPMTSSSPGTIRTLAAAAGPSSATVLGVAAAADW